MNKYAKLSNETCDDCSPTEDYLYLCKKHAATDDLLEAAKVVVDNAFIINPLALRSLEGYDVSPTGVHGPFIDALRKEINKAEDKES